MSITLELLDEHHKSAESTIIVGENVLLKFIPNLSLLSQRPRLKDIIGIKDLQKSEYLVWIKKIIKFTKDLKDVLGEYIQEYSNKKEADVLANYKENIVKISNSITEIERKMNISICEDHQLTFCTKCNAYVGEIDSLTTKCSECSNPITDTGKKSVRYLDKISNTFFDGGIWFEDYIQKLLEEEGWKVWTHGSVMGSSGVLHPVDILSIKDNKVLIAECKTGTVNTRDLSHFMIQKNDIPSHFGLFLSLQNCSSKSTASLFKLSTSILIDNIEEKTDLEIKELISKHIDKFK